MKINKSLYTKVASLLIAGTLSLPVIAQTQDVITESDLSKVITQNLNAYGNHSETSPQIQLRQMSEQGKIKSSQLIVKFKDVSAPAATNSTLANFSVDSITDFYTPSKMLAASKELFSKIKIVSFTKGTDLGKAFNDLLKDPTVEYVAPNYIFTLQATTPNDLNNNLWGLNNTGQSRTFADSRSGEDRTETGTADADIDAPEAWDIRHDANNTIVAVIDTGIDYNHSELASNMWTNPGEIAGNGIDDDNNGYIDDVHGYDFADNDSDPMDTHGHGTHCSGTIAAQGDNGNNITGVAWNTQLMALKIFGDGDNGAYTTDIVNAILYAADMGAKVSNNSYGSLFNNSVAANMIEKPLYDAISAANDAGMLFVAAAGNDSADLNQAYTSAPSGLELPNIISVAASDHNDEPAYFTNYGTTLVDIAAPGFDIYSTLPGNEYATWNGTSMAAPHVTGAAALLIEENSELTPAELKAIIMNNSDKPEALAETSASNGRLNIHLALSALQGGSGGSCESFTATNDSHVTAARAIDEVTGQTCWGTFCYGGTTTYTAVGSEENIGSAGYTTTTLYENETGVFSKTEDCQMGGSIDAPPVITLNGDIEKFILVGTAYTLPTPAASAVDREDGDISASIVSTGSFDTQTPGRYIITYNVTDSADNNAAPIARVIHVTETDSAPQILLQGDICNMMWCSSLNIETNTPYQEPGFIAYDLIDGDLTDSVYIIDDPMGDTSEEGVRFLNYDVVDSSGNHASQQTNRLVAVLDAEMPHIWVRPPSGEYFSYASEYFTWKRPDGDQSWSYRAYFSVIDLKSKSEEFDWDNDITVTGEDSVDYTTTGSYTVDISATDPDGNTANTSQIVHVIADTTAPVITLQGDSQVTVEIGDFYREPGGQLKDDLDAYPRTSMKYYDAQDNEISSPFYGRTTEETTYTVEYLGEDGAGNIATPKYRTVNVVRSHWDHPPILIGPSWRNNNDARIYGTAFDIDSDLNRVEIEFNEDGNWILINGLEEWSYTPDFYGRREFRIRVVDNNGNTDISEVNTFVSTAPVVIQTNQVQVNGTTALVSGTATDAEDDIVQIEVSMDGGDYVICNGTTSWNCTFAGLTYGNHSYKVRGLDENTYANNNVNYGFNVTPALPQIDNYDYSFDGNSLVVTGTASDADGDLSQVTLTADQIQIQCTGTTSFTCILPNLVEGTTYNVSLSAQDAYGNVSTATEFSATYEVSSSCFTTTNSEHINAARAELKYNVLVYALGSGNYLGMGGDTTSLEETSAGVWTKVTSCN